MVEVFSREGPVITRLSSDSLIEISALQDPDVDRFIHGVIAYVRDPAANLDALVKEAAASTTETIEPGMFPFTNEAIEALKSRLTHLMTPREITMKMTRALGRAFRANRPAVTMEEII
jgi:hypothetical protein